MMADRQTDGRTKEKLSSAWPQMSGQRLLVVIIIINGPLNDSQLTWDLRNRDVQ